MNQIKIQQKRFKKLPQYLINSLITLLIIGELLLEGWTKCWSIVSEVSKVIETWKHQQDLDMNFHEGYGVNKLNKDTMLVPQGIF